MTASRLHKQWEMKTKRHATRRPFRSNTAATAINRRRESSIFFCVRAIINYADWLGLFTKGTNVVWSNRLNFKVKGKNGFWAVSWWRLLSLRQTIFFVCSLYLDPSGMLHQLNEKSLENFFRVTFTRGRRARRRRRRRREEELPSFRPFSHSSDSGSIQAVYVFDMRFPLKSTARGAWLTWTNTNGFILLARLFERAFFLWCSVTNCERKSQTRVFMYFLCSAQRLLWAKFPCSGHRDGHQSPEHVSACAQILVDIASYSRTSAPNGCWAFNEIDLSQ